MNDQIYLIAAVGRRGQLGLGGLMPWHDKEDLAWFKQMTMGHVVVMGRRTMMSVLRSTSEIVDLQTPNVFATYGWHGREIVKHTRLETVRSIIDQYPNRAIWIAGGAKIYQLWLPYVRRCYITRIDYDGPADVWMPDLWEPAGNAHKLKKAT